MENSNNWKLSNKKSKCFLVYPNMINEREISNVENALMTLPMFMAINCSMTGVFLLYDSSYSSNELLDILKWNLPKIREKYELWVIPWSENWHGMQFEGEKE